MLIYFLFLLLFSILAAASSIDTIEESPFYLSILQTNCYDNIPIDMTPLEFDTSLTDQRVFDAMNILNDDHISLLEGALEDGVNFDVPYLLNQFPIHFAIEHERYEMFDLLVKKVDLNQRCILGLTPLHHALLEGNLHFIDALLRNGANPHENTLLHWEDERKNHFLRGRSFIEQSYYKTPMTEEFIAFMMGKSLWSNVKEVTKKAINAKNESLLIEMVKRSPLIDDTRTLMEICCDFPSAKEFLSSKDSEIEEKAQNFVEDLDIFWASKKGNLLAVKVLVLILNVDIKAQNGIGWTALHATSQYGHAEVAEFLIKNGCGIDVKDEYRWTALRTACDYGHVEVVKCLLRNGCNMEAKDQDGKTALHSACDYGHEEIVKCLVRNGCNMEAKDQNGWTAFHTACYYDHGEIVKFLANSGCNISARDKNGFTASNHASVNGRKSILKILNTFHAKFKN